MTPRRRKGIPPPRPLPESLYPTLDLHGQTADEAERSAERWLLAQQRLGEGVVRLITGRGRHSVGPPVLPLTIDDLLRRLTGSVVRSYQPESGGGAFRAELLRLKPKPTRRSEPDSQELDPEIALQAHQSLADLGVEPTPALLRLEAERIVKKPVQEAE